MRLIVIGTILIQFLIAHNQNKEGLEWIMYQRVGIVHSDLFGEGASGYTRLKRTTINSFRDIRIFAHFFRSSNEIRIRQKSSRHFLTFENIYSFNTLIYEKSNALDMNLRYHFDQGLGIFVMNDSLGNLTLELGLVFENEDYLNNQKKTAYTRGGISVDQTFFSFKIKFEVDHYYQINERINLASLTRYQLLSEVTWYMSKNFGLLSGFILDVNREHKYYPSLFLTFSYVRPIDWIY